jgi:hypothetical protein
LPPRNAEREIKQGPARQAAPDYGEVVCSTFAADHGEAEPVVSWSVISLSAPSNNAIRRGGISDIHRVDAYQCM